MRSVAFFSSFSPFLSFRTPGRVRNTGPGPCYESEFVLRLWVRTTGRVPYYGSGSILRVCVRPYTGSGSVLRFGVRITGWGPYSGVGSVRTPGPGPCYWSWSVWIRVLFHTTKNIFIMILQRSINPENKEPSLCF